MFTKKEKILIRPYWEKRYNQHREKVIKATPRIDFHPPAEHNHVALKLKKAQKELERQRQIENENIRLLQRLGSIMTKKRIDNFWQTPRPNFLSREPIIDYTASKSRSRSSSIRELPTISDDEKVRRRSKSAYRCTACSPGIPSDWIKEDDGEREPFAMPKESKNVRLRQNSMPHICCLYCCC
uniref:CSON012026 protein n=1 Tax=Culicoides sonorensis TaxID=179676 RepID=A0A336LLG1_CULSO